VGELQHAARRWRVPLESGRFGQNCRYVTYGASPKQPTKRGKGRRKERGSKDEGMYQKKKQKQHLFRVDGVWRRGLNFLKGKEECVYIKKIAAFLLCIPPTR
jgi:hypothetical protein